MGTATVQGELWGRHPNDWSSEIEPQMMPLYDAAVAALAPLAGRHVLDAGCGAGLAATRAAEAGATVSGLDASPGLLAVAAERLPGADLRTGEIESLPWEDATFDAVSAYNSIQYATDPQRAVEELARVCRPGGHVLVGVWGAPQRCETEALFARLRSLAPPPPGTPAPLGVSDPGVVEGLMEKAGLTVSGGGEARCSLTFRDMEHAWVAHTSAGPLQKVIDVAGEEPVRRVLTEVLEADRKPDGSLRQDNVFRFVVGQRD